MSEFAQHGAITTLYELGPTGGTHLDTMLGQAATYCKIGLILPTTAADVQTEQFSRIINELRQMAGQDAREYRN